jgi:DNA polymerase
LTDDPRKLLTEAVSGLKTYLEYEAADGVSEINVAREVSDTFLAGGASGQTPVQAAKSGSRPPNPSDAPARRKKEAPAPDQFEPPETGTSGAPEETLEQIREDLGDCTRCRLCEGRKTIVFGVGNPHADLVIVGEAPGRDEDITGEPFVGRAGQLLNRMLAAIGLDRSDIYICNVIKCRPPENRNPLPDEVASCEPYLIRQLRSMRPKVILAMGKFAAQTLLQTEEKISRLRGEFREYQGIPVMPTFHPAYLLRNQTQKRVVWEDLQQVHKALGLPPLSSSNPSER